jgi:hypothetical protein
MARWVLIALSAIVLIALGYAASRLLGAGSHEIGVSMKNLEDAEYPDVRGVWVLEMDTVGATPFAGGERGARHFPDGMSRERVEVTIDRQDEFRFSGTLSNPRGKESFSGIIGFGNTYANGVTESGYFWAQFISPDMGQIIFHHRCPAETVAGRGFITRKR